MTTPDERGPAGSGEVPPLGPPPASENVWARPDDAQPRTAGFPAPSDPIGYGPPSAYPTSADSQQPGYPTQSGYQPQDYAPQPGYGQPGVGQTAYGQAAYPTPYATDPSQPLYYDPNAPAPYVPIPPRRMATGLKVLLWAIPVIVLIACIGGGIAIARHNGGATAAGTGHSTSPGGLDTFTLPATALGLPRSTDQAMIDLAKTMQDLLDKGATGESAAAIYQGSPALNVLLVAGIPTTVDDPSAYVTSIFTGVATTLQVEPSTVYPAGPMGGVMRCANGTETVGTVTIDLSICAAVDSGGAFMTMYFDHDAATLASDTVQLRGTIESQ